MTDYIFEAKSIAIVFVDEKDGKHLAMSAALGSDGSGYLKLDVKHPENPDYLKFSYHPHKKIINFAITSEIWGPLDRPNYRRFLVKKEVEHGSALVDIYIDKSALYRIDQIKETLIRSVFPKVGGTRVKFYLEDGSPQISIKKTIATDRTITFIDEARAKIYELQPSLKTDIYNGCAQVPLDTTGLPIKLLCFGI